VIVWNAINFISGRLARDPSKSAMPAMPSFAWRLSDAQAAAVVTYIRNAWGNAASPVSPDQVRTVKGKRDGP
jgi:mono/diheme cytochrome c family protein